MKILHIKSIVAHLLVMKELFEPWPQLHKWIGINGANTLTQFIPLLLVAIQKANLVESRFTTQMELKIQPLTP